MAIGVFNGNFRAGMYREYRQQVEADAKNPLRALERIEEKLMLDCIALEGDKFVEYWDSDAVPKFGNIQDRIDLLRSRIADLQSQPSPIDEAQAIEVEIDKALAESVRNTEYSITLEQIAESNAKVKSHIFTADPNCKHEKAFPTYGGMMCRCGSKFAARNEFEQRLVNSRNPKGNGYVNWQFR